MFFLTKIIDEQSFLDVVGGDSSHLDTLIHLFREQSEDNIKSMYDAIAQNNREAFERAAHDLKNLGRNIASSKLVEYSVELEELIAANQLIDAEHKIEQTRKLLERAAKELVKIRRKMK